MEPFVGQVWRVSAYQTLEMRLGVEAKAGLGTWNSLLSPGAGWEPCTQALHHGEASMVGENQADTQNRCVYGDGEVYGCRDELVLLSDLTLLWHRTFASGTETNLAHRHDRCQRHVLRNSPATSSPTLPSLPPYKKKTAGLDLCVGPGAGACVCRRPQPQVLPPHSHLPPMPNTLLALLPPQIR